VVRAELIMRSSHWWPAVARTRRAAKDPVRRYLRAATASTGDRGDL